MSVDILGPHFDIHGGGMDLKFPHHENEIAQTCAACDSPFVNVWMHNGFVRVDDEKMSKSLGNFFTVREVLEWVRDPEVVRYFIVNSQYRGPINYTPDSLAQADAALERLYTSLRGVPVASPVGGRGRRRRVRAAPQRRFVAAMDDDFNTPIAVSELQALAREINTAKAAGNLRQGGGARGRDARARGAAWVARARAGGVPAQARGEAGDGGAVTARPAPQADSVCRSRARRRRHRTPDRRARRGPQGEGLQGIGPDPRPAGVEWRAARRPARWRRSGAR